MQADLADAPGERFYVGGLVDSHPAREAIEGFLVDANEYPVGLIRPDGRRKPAKAMLAGGGVEDASREGHGTPDSPSRFKNAPPGPAWGRPRARHAASGGG